jgi:hypothetical protein
MSKYLKFELLKKQKTQMGHVKQKNLKTERYSKDK